MRPSRWEKMRGKFWEAFPYGIIHLVHTRNFRKTNISYPLIRTRGCAYQGVRIVSFSDNFMYVLNG